MNSKILTRAELEAGGIEWVSDAVQMGFMSLSPGPRAVLDTDCWAVKNGGPDAVELGKLTVDEIETIEVYLSVPANRPAGGIGATVRSKRASIPNPQLTNTLEASHANWGRNCTTVYVWTR